MSSSLRPQFFCARPNGTLTPLIAVDELPAHVSLRGVPRVLSPNETQGMTSLGTVSSRGQFYTVEGAAATTARASTPNPGSHRSRNYELQSSLMRLLADDNVSGNQRMPAQALTQPGSPQGWPASNSAAGGWSASNTGGGTGNGNARQTTHSRNIKKEYCSYWIRHGECDYQQQGCLYKHEMPHDRAMLEKLGLRDIPRWYRDKFNIPSLLPPNGHGHPRSQSGSGNWKDKEVDFKSIQYPAQLEQDASEQQPSEFERNTKHKAVTYMPAQHHQAPMLTGASSNMSFHSAGSPSTASVLQKYNLKNTLSGSFVPADKKIDLLSYDRFSECPSNSSFVYHPAKDSAFDPPDRAYREDFARSLQGIALTPIPANNDYLTGAFDGNTRFKKTQKSRRLYQPRSRDHKPDNSSLELLADSDPLEGFHNHPVMSPISKGTATGTTSHLASPDTKHRTASEPPTPGASPTGTSISSSASPATLRIQSKPKWNNHGAIGTKKPTYRKKSGDSSDDDLFSFALDHGRK